MEKIIDAVNKYLSHPRIDELIQGQQCGSKILVLPRMYHES